MCYNGIYIDRKESMSREKKNLNCFNEFVFVFDLEKKIISK